MTKSVLFYAFSLWDAYRDVGGRVTHGAVTEMVGLRET